MYSVAINFKLIMNIINANKITYNRDIRYQNYASED